MPVPTNTADKPLWHYLLLVFVPALLLFAVWALSPNFAIAGRQATDSHPLGGDYLQEYVGGKIINSPVGSESLYDVDAFKKTQHDPAVTGFQWDVRQYFPPVYPPFWYAVAGLISGFSYPTAIVVWGAVMTVCLAASLGLIYRFTDAPLWLLLLFCICKPVIDSISSGQKGTVLLLIFTATFVLLKHRKPGRSGAVFAVSLFKPYLGVCVGLLMLVSGRWRWVAATLVAVTAIILGTWWAWPQLSRDYLAVCLGFGDYVQSGGYELEKSYSLWSGWQLLVPNAWAAKGLTIVSSLGVLVGALVWLRPFVADRRTEGQSKVAGFYRSRDPFELPFAVMMLVTAVTAPHFYYYDLTMLILPAAVFAGYASEQKFDRRRWLPTLMIALAMFGAGVIEQIAATTHISAGAILLLAAIGSGILVVKKTVSKVAVVAE